MPFLNQKVYSIIYGLLALSYIIGKVGKELISPDIRSLITYIGSYWLAAFVCMLIGFIFLDILRLVLNISGIQLATQLQQVLGGGVLAVIVVILAIGTWLANSSMVTTYEINIPKNGGKLQELHAVLVSDLHLGGINSQRSLSKMVTEVNALEPDLVLIAGDIIEEEVELAQEHNLAEIFSTLKSNYGVYAVPGNHEYYGNEAAEILSYLTQGGIKVLRDSYTLIADSFYLVGRDDGEQREQLGAKRRANLAELMAGIDHKKPIILMNHRPVGLAEAKEQGVDLQVSGHTHRGQIFPGNLVTARIFEIDWGHLQKDDFHLLVTSGYGLWGPPIRLGSRSEIVQIKLRFEE